MVGDQRYDAFISYNHSVDGRLAEALRTGLQRFAKPWNRRRAMRVFLDRDSLEATSSLSGALEDKLGGARFLILLASDESAASPWCDHEARYWLKHRDADSLLLVLTDASGGLAWDEASGRFDAGTSTSLPPSLLEAYADEPLWQDMRWVEAEGAEAELDIREPRFRNAIAALAATIHAVPKDELDSEDLRQHRKFTRIRQVAVAVLAALTVTAGVLGVLAVRSRNDARSALRDLEAANGTIDELEVRAGDLNTANELATEQLEGAKADLASANTSIGALETQAEELELANKLAADELATTQAEAARQETIGDTRRLAGAALSRLTSQLDLASLAAIESVRKAEGVGPPTPLSGDDLAVRRAELEAQDALLRTLQEQPRLIRMIDVGSPVRSVAFHPDKALLASAGEDGQVITWDTTTGQISDGPLEADANVVAFSPDGTRLAIGGDDGRILLLDPDDLGQAPVELGQGGPAVWSLAFGGGCGDAQRLAVGRMDSVVEVWDPTRPAAPLALLHEHAFWARSVAISADCRWLVAGDGNGTVRLWDLTTSTLFAESNAVHFDVLAVAFGPAPGATGFASAGVRGPVALWDVPESQPESDGPLRLEASGEVFSPEVVRRSEDDDVSVEVNALAFSGDGAHLAMARFDGTVRVWNVTRNALRTDVLGGHRGHVRTVAFAPTGTELASGGDDGQIRLWDLDRSPPLTHDDVGVPSSEVIKADLASRWESRDHGLELAVLPAEAMPAEELRGIAESPDGRLLVTMDRLAAVRILDAEAFELVAVAFPGEGIPAGVNVAFSPDGSLLAIRTFTGVRLWSFDLQRIIGQPLTAGDATSLFGDVVFSSSGGHLGLMDTSGGEGVVHVWDVQVATWIERACDRANRNMTDEEWSTLLPADSLRATCEA